MPNETATPTGSSVNATTSTTGSVVSTTDVGTTSAVDLVTRVSQVKTEAPVTTSSDSFDTKEFDSAIDAIKDPLVKEQFSNLRKSLVRGANAKYEELSKQRKEVEAKLRDFSTWSPQKVAAIAKDPDFLNAAQAYYASVAPAPTSSPTLTADEYSALSDREKQEFETIKREMAGFKEQNYQMKVAAEDQALVGKYANYDSRAVDGIFNDMVSGKVLATREHLWKVHDYEDACRRAYQLGLQDKQGINTERAQGASLSATGVNVVDAADRPQREVNEKGIDFFKRIAAFNMARRKG